MGRLIYASKQYDGTGWFTSQEDVQQIGNVLAYALASTALPEPPGLVAAVPSSRGTNSLPFQIAKDLAFLAGIRYAPADAIAFFRQVPQVKEVSDYWEKRELLHGAMIARPDVFRNRHVVVVDDVCRTGATLRECARACLESGAASVSVLTVSKTFEFQRIPDTQRVLDDVWVEA